MSRSPEMDYHKIATDVTEKILSYSKDTSGWKTVKTTKDIVVSCKPSNEYSGNIYRGEAIMEGTPEIIIPFMYIPEYRAKWDSALKHYVLKEQIDEDTTICYIITHSYGMGLISARDFVDLLHVERYDGGVITTNSVSVDHEKIPVSNTLVRGHNNPCGYVCSPLPEDPAFSKLVVFIQPDLGGFLPRSLVESALPNNIVSLINDARAGLKEHLVSRNK